MELLRKYCSTISCINGLDTYIISPTQYDSLIADRELLERLSTFQINYIVMNFLPVVREVNADELYFAFVHHKNWKRCEWEPVLCYKNEDTFYHVAYRDSWMCRECNYELYASIIMPMCEADPVFYSGTENKYPNIPPFFQKISCPECGRLLQNHLIIMK